MNKNIINFVFLSLLTFGLNAIDVIQEKENLAKLDKQIQQTQNDINGINAEINNLKRDASWLRPDISAKIKDLENKANAMNASLKSLQIARDVANQVLAGQNVVIDTRTAQSFN